ncbi:bifunctional 2-polyprenyl-6-hydroxyphenol methylase/3-demethylubiquinol 3-O-methyltransferase UbiG [Thorsellia anophelis]|uniref:Ubiquinone biosynthesis O-methyltransferase n=1 Tax=Thorsellia anophelis DSM 18579 TaxID=1123402 RepID=A0A1I0CU09_9GAMM|nr:bifunctional 2-polyprenyl-6-hydroxyphenol methylase/3-demethylubiquinol 3-O-methyltransferase UbiG [Thorsellia anophelis]SET22871.1 3-demethylubiquinone-9 3-methyltransferase [Thorsellia anophelis DSM 18579]
MTPTHNKMNVDPKEIEKFASIASRWWDVNGEFKPLHRINPLRLGYIAEHANGLFEKRIVDVGCGGGILAESMARQGAFVTGIDMGLEPLEVARLHALESQLEIDYQQITAESFAEENFEKFDIVTCMEMLEHVPNPASVVQACAKMVKPGGLVYFSTINRTIKAFLGAIIAAEYILQWVPKGTHDIKKCIKPSELMSYIDATPLYAKNMIGLHYNPLKDSFYLGDNVDVNYMLCCIKPK